KFTDIRGMLVDPPTGELLLIDDNKIRLLRRHLHSKPSPATTTVANLFCLNSLDPSTEFDYITAFTMAASTHDLFIMHGARTHFDTDPIGGVVNLLRLRRMPLDSGRLIYQNEISDEKMFR